MALKYYFRCPKCGNDEEFVRPSEETSNLGCALLVFGGFIPALLFADHNRRRVQCTRCTQIFRAPAVPRGPLATFADWIVILTIVPALIALLFVFSHELAELLPATPILAPIEEAIAREPRVAVHLLGVMLVLIVLPSCLVGLVASWRFRKQLSTKYRLKPLSSQELVARHDVPAQLPREDNKADG